MNNHFFTKPSALSADAQVHVRHKSRHSWLVLIYCGECLTERVEIVPLKIVNYQHNRS
jgi:hypothetical protein